MILMPKLGFFFIIIIIIIIHPLPVHLLQTFHAASLQAKQSSLAEDSGDFVLLGFSFFFLQRNEHTSLPYAVSTQPPLFLSTDN